MAVRTLSTALILLASVPAWADFEAGRLAYERGDYAAALLEWAPLAKQGDARAQFAVALLYHHGQGVSEDRAEATKWYRRAAEQGMAAAQLNLGLTYATGEGGVKKDFSLAARWCRTAADQGDAQAQFALGKLYAYGGPGLNRDMAQAVLWYRKAAEQGEAGSQAVLCAIYERGQDVPKDYASAASWCERAAEQNNQQAQFLLGGLYTFGEGIPKDLSVAYMWLTVASHKNGEIEGVRIADVLNELVKVMSPEQILRGREMVANWRPKQTESADTPTDTPPNAEMASNRPANEAATRVRRYIALEMYNEASSVAESALKSDEFNSEIRYLYGLALQGLRRFTDAAREFKIAVKLDGTDWLSLYHLLQSYMASYSEAPTKGTRIAAYETALQLKSFSGADHGRSSGESLSLAKANATETLVLLNSPTGLWRDNFGEVQITERADGTFWINDTDPKACDGMCISTGFHRTSETEASAESSLRIWATCTFDTDFAFRLSEAATKVAVVMTTSSYRGPDALRLPSDASRTGLSLRDVARMQDHICKELINTGTFAEPLTRTLERVR